MTYVCPVCGVEASRPVDCEQCNVALEKVCDGCGELESQCACGRSGGGEEEESNIKEEE